MKNNDGLYYEEHGNGKPVVMMHGWTSTHDVFSKPVSLLSGKARFICYDHRGHGGSKAAGSNTVSVEMLADDLNELIEGLQLDQVILLGWSMGASTAFTYIGKYGCSRLSQVVLCDMTPKKINDADWHLGLYKGGYTGSDSLADKQKDCKTLFHEYALKTDPKLERVPAPLLKAGLRKKLKECDEATLLSLFHSMNGQDLRKNVGKITVPLTYFYSEQGTLYSPELAKWYGDNVNVPYKSVAFPDSTHLFISEHPKEFSGELEKLI